jgi:molybdopterin-guanine dinucleotide biosynthesis protein A
MNMRAIILAGGQNRRIKTNKSLLRLGDKTVIEWITESLFRVFPEIIIVTNNPELYSGLGCRLTKDLFPAKGSLVGLYSGLLVSPSQYNFLVACDMPFVNYHLIRYLVDLVQKQKNNIELLIPKTDEGYQPLHAIYSRDCLPLIKKQLEEANLKILDLFPHLQLKEVEQEELIRFDPQLLSFFNINTLDDWRQALVLFSKILNR